MKKIVFLFVIVTAMSFSLLNENNYYLLFEKNNSIKFFKYGKYYYYEIFLNKKKEINGNLYYVEIRKFSFGDIDTTYIRKSDVNYMQFNRITNAESILIPINPKIGDIWFENDQSWKYEVIEEKVNFQTPNKKFVDCVLIRCKQLTNRDSNKEEVYFLYYSPKFGFVGSVDKNKKIVSYLKEIKLNTKKGDYININ